MFDVLDQIRGTRLKFWMKIITQKVEGRNYRAVKIS